MDLFKDIRKGKKFTKVGLRHEAEHELKELGGMKKAEAYEKALKHGKDMKKDSMGGKSRFNPFAEKMRGKAKGKALDSMKVGKGRSRISGKSYGHDTQN